MSVLIKGMDMLKHAAVNGGDDTMYRSCVIVHPDGTAELVVDLEFADKFNFEHCLKRFPLVEVPTPHGDLIDISDQDNITVIYNSRGFIREVTAPTIIEAEGRS